MKTRDELDLLAGIRPPEAHADVRLRALDAALGEFDLQKKNHASPQGSAVWRRLLTGASLIWRPFMHTETHTRRRLAGPAIATLLLIPVAGVVTWNLMQSRTMTAIPPTAVGGETEKDRDSGAHSQFAAEERKAEFEALADKLGRQNEVADIAQRTDEAVAARQQYAPAAQSMSRALQGAAVPQSREFAVGILPPRPEPFVERENRDRFARFSTNPVKRVAEEPVSTFSIDVDTASYAFMRRQLKNGILPERESVRVEELINYFPYDWPAPQSAETPFQPTVTVISTPWNAGTLLMHVAIKGYELPVTEKPRSNLVFLIDTSGSMQDADKLPLVKASLKLLLDRLSPEDTVGLVTYAGNAGVALESTKVADRAKIIAAIDGLGAGGSTAGAAGIEEAYRLAEKAFVKGGVNRVMLATDGDFNVGPSDDASLKRLIEEKRKSSVFLSVMGFGQGNYNDQMMQVIAQNGNGTAAYIDTLAEAEKTLVQEAGSTLFPIAKDVKIQVEFNPSRISEYRLIGYETRALNREDFNNDRIDAGEIGSGHSVTAIYELTPIGSAAETVSQLRYQQQDSQPARQDAANGELGFLKMRFKKADADTSELLSLPVTEHLRTEFDSAPTDVRFSVAVAAFGQKLRDADALAGFGFGRIGEIANAAKGTDEFGYRGEFVGLVRLAAALAGK